MGARPTVSIVVDNFNYGRFLRTAIESALSQTYPRVEVVVVDDGSTDDSRDIIRSYSTDVIPVFQNNGGQTSALNAGFRHASGDVVCFLDADDSLYPSAAEAAATLLAEPDVARGVWSLHSVDTTGRVLGMMPRGEIPGDDRTEVLRGGDPHGFAIAPTSSNAWSRAFLDTMLPLPCIEREVGYGSAMADSLLAMASLAYGPTRGTADVHGRYLVHGDNDLVHRDLYGRMAMHLAILPRHYSLVAQYARSRGLMADDEAWKRRSFWFRLARAVDSLVSCSRTWESMGHIALADEGWRLDVGAPFPAVPLMWRDGEWWGPPGDGAEAIREIERARSDGARAVAFLWPSFWWLDDADLTAHLRSAYRSIVENDDLIVFDLTGQERS